MSGLFRPVGHLPASAYWIRRLVMAGLVLLIGWVLVAWLAPDSGEGKQQPNTSAGSTTPEPEPTAKQPEREVDGSNAEQSAHEANDKADPADPATSDEKSAEKKNKSAEKDESDPRDLGELPPCPDGVLSAKVVPEKDPAEAGKPLDLRITFVSDASDSCKIPVSPDTVGLSIVSGSDPIWNTEECDTVIPTGPLSMKPGEPRVISVNWPGRRSAEGCPDDTDAALPGYYLVELTLNDVALDSGRFRLF